MTPKIEGGSGEPFDLSRLASPRLLFVRLRSLGDTVLMTPVLEAARRLLGVRIGVVVETPFDQVLEGNPALDVTIAIDRGSDKFAARVRAIRRIRAFRPDVVIDLHGGTTSALMTFLSGAGSRVGYATSRNARLYNVRIPDTRVAWGKSSLHTVEHQLAPLKLLGCPVEPVPPLRVPVLPDRVRQMAALLERQGATSPFVLVHPAAAFSTKQWPAGNFAELIGRIAAMPTHVVVTAGPGEERLLEEIRGLTSGAAIFVPPMSIPDFIAMTSLCNLYVGNDTGATHIAAALGKPVAVIFGSSDSAVWHPWGVRYELIRSDLACIPCPGYRCLEYSEPRCIQSIDVDRVFAAVSRLLCK